MASIVLGLAFTAATEGAGFAATSAAVAVAGAVGGAIGGYVDSTLILPAIFGNKQQGPGLSIDDLRVQTASEGTPMKFCIGEANRMAGTIIWMGDFQTQDGTSGGKNGLAQNTYAIDVAIAWCEGVIENVDLIWADSIVIYDRANTVVGVIDTCTVTSVVNPVSEFHVSGLDQLTGYYNGGKIKWLTGELANTFSVVVNQFTGVGTAGEISIIPTPYYSEGSRTPVYLHINVGDTFTIQAPYPEDGTASHDERFDSITFYTGTPDQLPDPLIQAIEGAAFTPGFIGIAYTIIKGLVLTSWGNRLPQFSGLIRQKTGATPGYAIDRILKRSTLDPSQWDVSALASITDVLVGFTISGPQALDKLIEPILTAWNIIAKEEGGVLTFFPRVNSVDLTIDADDLAAHEFGNQVDRLVKIEDSATFDLPTSVEVMFVDPTRGHQNSSMREKRLLGTSGSTTTINMPFTMTALQARTIGRRLLWGAYAERNKVSFSLPPKYIGIQEGDLLTVPIDRAATELCNVRVATVDQGWNFVLEVGGVTEEAQTLNPPATADDGSGGTGGEIPPLNSPQVILLLLNTPPLNDGQIDVPGFYWCVCSSVYGAKWGGANLWTSWDGGTTYSNPVDSGRQAFIGQTNNAVGAPVTFGVRDDVNYVDVTMFFGTLASASFADITQGTNWILVGDEILAFETATLEAPNQYKLTGLWRGLRDTTDTAIITGHVIGEALVLIGINGQAIHFYQTAQSAIGHDRFYKAVPANKTLETSIPIDFTGLGITCVPFRPDPLTRGSVPGGASITAFGTGDSYTGAIDAGAIDNHWTITGNTAYVASGDVTYWNPIVTGKKYVSIHSDHTSDPLASPSNILSYNFNTTITIPVGFDYTTKDIAVDIAVDNTLVDILINGVSAGLTFVDVGASVTVFNGIVLPKVLLKYGANTVTFVVSDNGVIMGLSVVWIPTTTDILIQWQRRGRWQDATFGTGSFPNDEPFEQYNLTIFEWTGFVPGSQLRVVTINTTQQYLYSTAQQVADGRVTPGAPIYIEIYQQGKIKTGNTNTGVI